MATEGDTKTCASTKPGKRRLEISIAVKLNLKDVNGLVNKEEVKDLVRKHLTPNAESEKKLIADYLQERSHTWPRIDIGFKKNTDLIDSTLENDAQRANHDVLPGLLDENNDDLRETIKIVDDNKTEPVPTHQVDDANDSKRDDGELTLLFNKDAAMKDINIEEVIQVEPKIDIAIPKHSELLPYALQLPSVNEDRSKVPMNNVAHQIEQKVLNPIDKKYEINLKNDFEKIHHQEEFVAYPAESSQLVKNMPEEDHKGITKDLSNVDLNEYDKSSLQHDEERFALKNKDMPNGIQNGSSHSNPDDKREQIISSIYKNFNVGVQEAFKSVLPSCKISYLTDSSEQIGMTEFDGSDENNRNKNDDLRKDCGQILPLSEVKKHVHVEDDLKTINQNEEFARNTLDFNWENERGTRKIKLVD